MEEIQGQDGTAPPQDVTGVGTMYTSSESLAKEENMRR